MQNFFEDPKVSEKYFENASEYSFFFSEPKEMYFEFSFPFSEEKEKFSKTLEEIGIIRNQDFEYHLLAIGYHTFPTTQREYFFSWDEESGEEYPFPLLQHHIKQADQKTENLPKFYTEAGNAYFSFRDCDSAQKMYSELINLAPSAFHDRKNDPEKFRLFIKHASAFDGAMRNNWECEKRK